MKYSERALQVKPSLTLTITSKVKALKKKGVDVVGFGAGEPDFDTPDNIKEAGILAIQEGFTKYTPATGTLELKEAICEKFRKDNGLEYVPDEVVVSCGAKHSLYNIFQAICNRGDEVIIASPYWVSYPEIVRLSGATPRFIATSEKNGFAVNPAELEKSISRKTKAIIVNSPSNPTGAVLGEEALYKIAKIAISKNVFVISDEIYEKLIYDQEKHVSIASFGKEIRNLAITVNGVSKTYAMTGWRIGYLAGPVDIIRIVSALQSHSTSNPTSISQMAALEALRGDRAAPSRMQKEFMARRDYMVKRINSLGKVSCVKPKGAFYLFVNIAKTGLDSLVFSGRLLDEAHVACVPGTAFGSDEHIRLSFATSMGNIRKGLDRMENWLKGL